MIPRLATANHLKRVDRSLEHAGQQLGLEFCRNWQDIEKMGMLRGVETGIFDASKFAAFSQIPAPCTCTTCSDQESTQVTGQAFCEDPNGLALTMVCTFDFFHRWWNCLNTAMARSGLTPIFYAAVMMYNLGYGPWESCAWWALLLAEIDDVASGVKPDSPLLLAYWPQIMIDKKLHASKRDADVGKLGRQRYIESLKCAGSLDIRNRKVVPSIWCSFNIAHDAWDEHIGTRGFLLGSLCMRKGWLNHISDLFGTPTNIKPAIVEGGKSGAVKSAKAKIEALKKSAGHSVAAVAKVIADRDVVAGVRSLAHGSRRIYTYFSKVQRELKGPEACAAFSQEWASWGWLAPLKETLQQREDLIELSRCGVTTVFPSAYVKSMTTSSPEVVYQDSLARTFGLFTEAIVEEISGHMLWWSAYYPGKFALMGMADHKTVKQAMRDFHDDCQAYWAAKAVPLAWSYTRAACTSSMSC